MHGSLARLDWSFAIATAVAGLAVATSAVFLTLVPAAPAGPATPLPWLDRGWYQAVSGAFVLPIGILLRRRQEATAYALLFGACVLAGWAIEARWHEIDRFDDPRPWGDLLAGLATVSAPTAVIAVFASTPTRRLARWSPLVLAVVVIASVLAVVTQRSSREEDASLGRSLIDWFSSATIWLTVLGIAVTGSVRNEAERYVPTTAVPRRDATVPRRLGYFLVASLIVALLAIPAGLQLGETARGQTLLPLLAALGAIVGARWSAYVAWTGLAISLAVGGAVIFGSALEIELQKLVENLEAPWVPTTSWLLPAGSSLLIAAAGLAAASSAVIEGRLVGRPRAHGDGTGVWTLTAIATGVAVWATLSWLHSRDGFDAPLLEGPLWAMYMSTAVLACLLLLGAGEALRGRLVPAIAEAEATARRPLRPFRYLETVAVETLTARAAVRRSAIAAERSRLASDLHAEILPSLADIRARYEAGAPDADVAARLRELEREVRDLMAERRLVVLEEFGIVEAIEWLVGRAEERAALEVQLSVDDQSTAERPPREVERAAFRIAQLAVENALQHAAPTRLELQVLARSDEVRVSVLDDGSGFRPATGSLAGDRLGISDMHAQAAEVHGDVQVVSPPSGGTMVTFAWPSA